MRDALFDIGIRSEYLEDQSRERIQELDLPNEYELFNHLVRISIPQVKRRVSMLMN